MAASRWKLANNDDSMNVFVTGGYVVTFSVVICLVTSLGIVVNYAVYRILDELLLNNTTLNDRVVKSS